MFARVGDVGQVTDRRERERARERMKGGGEGERMSSTTLPDCLAKHRIRVVCTTMSGSVDLVGGSTSNDDNRGAAANKGDDEVADCHPTCSSRNIFQNRQPTARKS